MKSEKHQVPQGRLIKERYDLVRSIGQGGMAEVYLAYDRANDDRPVAVKILRDDLSDDQEFVKRFATEARAASLLDHPNIVKVLDYGQDGRIRYIVQEYVEGMTLKDLIEQEGRLTWPVAVPLAIQIGLALEHAHRNGIIHRDIKPHNILITADKIAKVTDFGIARATNSNTITLTTGVAFGSVHYFSPEQARGSLVVEKSDIYSLGVVIYEMLTGQIPFTGDTPVAVAIKHLQEMPQPPSAVYADIPDSLDRIVFKCMQKSPDGRYSDIRELVDELDAFMIEPEGLYGIITDTESEHASTTALALKRPDPNYGKLRDVEKAIVNRRRSRNREIAIIVAIILVAAVFLVAVGSWASDRIKQGFSQTEPLAEFEVGEYGGMDLDDVKKILDAADILYEVEYREDSRAEGVVIDQYPAPGIRIKPGGTTVILYVSGGQDLITIPDYANEAYSLALLELEQTYGMRVSLRYEYSNIGRDKVIKTVPSANMRVPRGSEIILFVSEGLPTVEVPDFTGVPFIEMRDELINLNLVLGPLKNLAVNPETGQPVEVPENKRIVIKQNPQAGETVMPQTVISVTYGTAEDYENFLNPSPTPVPFVVMPDLVGGSYLTGLEQLVEFDLVLGPETSIAIDPATGEPTVIEEKDRVIIQQKPQAGEEVEPQTSVALIYGTRQDYENYLNPTPVPTSPPTETEETTAEESETGD